MSTVEAPTSPKLDPATATGSRSASTAFIAPWALLAIGLACWIVALSRANLAQLGPWGLLPALSITWYVAAAIAAGVFLFALMVRGRPPRGLLFASLSLMLLVLYGTTSLIENAPRLAWTYKHIGVTNYILAHGSVDPSIDIYQRWPGAFAFSAYLAKLLGVSDPTAFAGWAQLFYAVVLAMLVFALARAVSANVRSAWVAAAVFSCANTAGQLYFAPQPLALSMHLAILLIIVLVLRTSPNTLGRRVEGIIRPKAGAIEPSRLPRPTTAVKWAAIGSVLLLQLVSTVSHQLTPYLTIGMVLALAVLGYVRSKILVIGVVVITVAYLIPNISYINSNYGGLFHSLDLFSNFTPPAQAATPRLGIKTFIGYLAPGLALIVGLLALLGVVVRWRRGGRRMAVLATAGIAVPLALGLVQNYGGEAYARALLFALPWCAIAIGWLVIPVDGSGRWPLWRTLTTAGVSAAILGMFIVNFLGNEDLNYMPKAEVQACQWLSANSPANSVYIQSVTGFPNRCTADYYLHLDPKTGDTPNLLTGNPKFAFDKFKDNNSKTVNTVYNEMLGYGKDSRLIFSTSEQSYARAYGLFGGDAGYRRLEAAISASPRLKLLFENSDTRIYGLVVHA